MREAVADTRIAPRLAIRVPRLEKRMLRQIGTDVRKREGAKVISRGRPASRTARHEAKTLARSPPGRCFWNVSCVAPSIEIWTDLTAKPLRADTSNDIPLVSILRRTPPSESVRHT